MPAGGESHNADLVGINANFFSAGTDDANRTLSVLPRGHMLRKTFAARNAILQDDDGDSLRIEILGDLNPFMFIREALIRAAGADDHARVARLRFRLPNFIGRLDRVGLLARRDARPNVIDGGVGGLTDSAGRDDDCEREG